MKSTATTYPNLKKWARGYAKEHFDLLIVVGAPGIGKSRIIRDCVKNQARIIQGRTTAFQLYCEAYRYRDQPIVIDDVDQLYTDKDSVRLVKCLCQSETDKIVAWNSATSKLDEENIPHEFTTRSKVAIIANIWKNLNANIEAIEDRGILLYFQPTPAEVHQWVATWAKQHKISTEVYTFIGKHLHLIPAPSGRDYITAQQVKDAGQNWQDALYETWGLTPEKLLVAELLADPKLNTNERFDRFHEKTKSSRATYYRLKKELTPAVAKG